MLSDRFDQPKISLRVWLKQIDTSEFILKLKITEVLNDPEYILEQTVKQNVIR